MMMKINQTSNAFLYLCRLIPYIILPKVSVLPVLLNTLNTSSRQDGSPATCFSFAIYYPFSVLERNVVLLNDMKYEKDSELT